MTSKERCRREGRGEGVSSEEGYRREGECKRGEGVSREEECRT